MSPLNPKNPSHGLFEVAGHLTKQGVCLSLQLDDRRRQYRRNLPAHVCGHRNLTLFSAYPVLRSCHGAIDNEQHKRPGGLPQCHTQPPLVVSSSQNKRPFRDNIKRPLRLMNERLEKTRSGSGLLKMLPLSVTTWSWKSGQSK